MVNPNALIEMLRPGGVVALTGAGMSTDSGIPDYRGDAARVRKAPITYREFVTREASRRRYWARSHVGWTRIRGAEPNDCHRALAVLEQEGWVASVITQNVDGLHQRGGSRSVLELHGSLGHTVCLECGDRRSRLELHHRFSAANPWFDRHHAEIAPDGDADIPEHLSADFVVVDCLECGGILKPDVVFFGENVPRHRVQRAFEWVERSAGLLVLGSSLAVMSGYRFVKAATKVGLPVAIVNRGPSRGDEDAVIRIDGALAPVLNEMAVAATASLRG